MWSGDKEVNMHDNYRVKWGFSPAPLDTEHCDVALKTSFNVRKIQLTPKLKDPSNIL